MADACDHPDEIHLAALTEDQRLRIVACMASQPIAETKRPEVIKAKGKGMHPPLFCTLACGLHVVIKHPAAHSTLGPELVHREVAAGQVAKALGYEDIVPPTVLRIEEADGRPLEVSCQLLVDYTDEAATDRFGFDRVPERHLRRAALFDHLTDQRDRRGHNWLIAPAPDGERIVLFDNGASFGLGERLPVQSDLTDAYWPPRDGADFPELAQLDDPEVFDRLVALIGEQDLADFEARLRKLLHSEVGSPA